jgi:hypothetical protein
MQVTTHRDSTGSCIVHESHWSNSITDQKQSLNRIQIVNLPWYTHEFGLHSILGFDLYVYHMVLSLLPHSWLFLHSYFLSTKPHIRACIILYNVILYYIILYCIILYHFISLYITVYHMMSHYVIINAITLLFESSLRYKSTSFCLIRSPLLAGKICELEYSNPQR